MERAGHVREKYDLRSGKLFAKSKAFANLTRRVVRGIESERALHVLYHVGYAVYITCNRVALYHVRQRVGVLYHVCVSKPLVFVLRNVQSTYVIMTAKCIEFVKLPLNSKDQVFFGLGLFFALVISHRCSFHLVKR